MGKYSFDGVRITPDVERAVENRFMTKKPDFKRLPTNYPELDDVLGGLPYGISIFYGEAGTGKSMMAKAIASQYYTIYVCCESLIDYPEGGVKVMNYTRFLPLWEKALNELLVAIVKKEPELVVIDSVTTFFSGTKKAVEEADVRRGIFDLAKKVEGIIPIICTSEVRGSGYSMYEAGGRAVGHASSLLVKFNKIKVDRWTTKKYGAGDGDRLWTIDIEKDKQGIAQQGSEFQIIYTSDGGISLRRISYTDSSK